jgi:hypothetical protein
MTRRLTTAICLVVWILTACRAVTPGAPDSAASDLADPSAPSPGAATAAASTDACELGMGIAEYEYPGLREFVGEFRSLSRGVAVAEVLTVGDLQYATESGERPSCAEIQAAQAVFGIGRLVEVRVLTPAGGAVEKGEVLSYLYQGGSLGADASPGHPLGLQVPNEGERVLVLIARTPVDADPGTGELPVDVLEMFSISPQGRVLTPDPTERVPVDRVADLLRDVLPSPTPGG